MKKLLVILGIIGLGFVNLAYADKGIDSLKKEYCQEFWWYDKESWPILNYSEDWQSYIFKYTQDGNAYVNINNKIYWPYQSINHAYFAWNDFIFDFTKNWKLIFNYSWKEHWPFEKISDLEKNLNLIMHEEQEQEQEQEQDKLKYLERYIRQSPLLYQSGSSFYSVHDQRTKGHFRIDWDKIYYTNNINEEKILNTGSFILQYKKSFPKSYDDQWKNTFFNFNGKEYWPFNWVSNNFLENNWDNILFVHERNDKKYVNYNFLKDFWPVESVQYLHLYWLWFGFNYLAEDWKWYLNINGKDVFSVENRKWSFIKDSFLDDGHYADDWGFFVNKDWKEYWPYALWNIIWFWFSKNLWSVSFAYEKNSKIFLNVCSLSWISNIENISVNNMDSKWTLPLLTKQELAIQKVVQIINKKWPNYKKKILAQLSTMKNKIWANRMVIYDRLVYLLSSDSNSSVTTPNKRKNVPSVKK